MRDKRQPSDAVERSASHLTSRPARSSTRQERRRLRRCRRRRSSCSRCRRRSSRSLPRRQAQAAKSEWRMTKSGRRAHLPVSVTRPWRTVCSSFLRRGTSGARQRGLLVRAAMVLAAAAGRTRVALFRKERWPKVRRSPPQDCTREAAHHGAFREGRGACCSCRHDGLYMSQSILASLSGLFYAG